jgi:hypothetical protein
MKNVLQKVAAICFLGGNVTDPNSRSTYPNSPAILQKFVICKALKINNLAHNSLMFQTFVFFILWVIVKGLYMQ